MPLAPDPSCRSISSEEPAQAPLIRGGEGRSAARFLGEAVVALFILAAAIIVAALLVIGVFAPIP